MSPIDPPYRLDPFQNIVDVHWKGLNCPPEGEGYPGLVIRANNYGIGNATLFVDFYLSINSTGPHYSGNPNWPASEHPSMPAALCADAGVLLDESIGPNSGSIYTSAVSVSIPYVTNPETGGPSAEAFAMGVADDWVNIKNYIELSISQAGLNSLSSFADSAFDKAKQDYYDSIANEPNGQQQPSNDITNTSISQCDHQTI